MKCLFLDYIQFLMIGQVIRVTNINQNAKKGPLSHQKMKCSFLDYIQLLMITGADPGGPWGPGSPLITKNEAPAPKFYKIEAPEWQF